MRDVADAFRPAGRFAYYFARGKLGGDPAFMAMLEHGWLAGCRRLVDIGCGQGLLFAWLIAARRRYERGEWPAGWPEPPQPESLHGIELMPKDVHRARTAVGATATFAAGDLRELPFAPCDVIVVLDVLHYVDHDAQSQALARMRAALPAGGRLLLRVGNAAGGLAFRYGNFIDALVLYFRGHRSMRLCCRSVGDWRALLARHRFTSDPLPLSDGTPFANVLLLSRAI